MRAAPLAALALIPFEALVALQAEAPRTLASTVPDRHRRTGRLLKGDKGYRRERPTNLSLPLIDLQ
jgi:hypothetical protein